MLMYIYIYQQCRVCPVHRWLGVTEDGIGLTMATVAMPVSLRPLPEAILAWCGSVRMQHIACCTRLSMAVKTDHC